MDRYDVENLRRSIAMQTGVDHVLARDEADALLRRLYDLERLLDEVRRLLADLDG